MGQSHETHRPELAFIVALYFKQLSLPLPHPTIVQLKLGTPFCCGLSVTYTANCQAIMTMAEGFEQDYLLLG